MQTRVVYDVANDGFPWLGIAFTIHFLLIAILILLEMLKRFRGQAASGIGTRNRAKIGRLPNLALAALALIALGIGIWCGWHTADVGARRQRCQEWLRAAQFQVTEGVVTDYQFRKAGPSFSVGGISFDLLNQSVGFRGRFNVPAAWNESLREGETVRLSHRDGYILRVELAAP